MRALRIGLVAVLCLLLLASIASADESDFGKEVQVDGTVIITSWTGTGNQVTVPETLDGLTVSGIASGVFPNKANLTVILPDGLTNINSNAFGSIYSPYSRIVCHRMSATAQNLTYQFFDPEEPDFALRWQNGLLKLMRYDGEPGNVIVPNGVQYIRDATFQNVGDVCVTLPDSVVEISNYAFASSDSVTVYLPDHVTSLGKHNEPFGGTGVNHLAKVFCNPNSETAEQLKALNCPFRVPEAPACILRWVDDVLTMVDVEDSVSPVALPSVDVVIPVETMEKLPCFSLPTELHVIESEAFRYCNENRIVISAGIESIGANAFADSPNLVMIRFPAGNISIDNTCLFNCPHVTVYAPAGSYALQWAQDRELNTVAE